MHTQTHGIRFEDLNWVASPPLQRDKEQSHLLHQPVAGRRQADGLLRVRGYA
jgi:hypothetical protein